MKNKNYLLILIASIAVLVNLPPKTVDIDPYNPQCDYPYIVEEQ